MTVFGDINVSFKIKFVRDETLRGKCLNFSQVVHTLNWLEDQLTDLKNFATLYQTDVATKCGALSPS